MPRMPRHRLIALIVTVSVLGYFLTPAALVPCCCKTLSSAAAQKKASACCQAVKPVKACCADRAGIAACSPDEVCKKGVQRCRCLEQMATVAVLSAHSESSVAKLAVDMKVFGSAVEQRRPTATRPAFSPYPHVDPPGVLHKTCNLLC